MKIPSHHASSHHRPLLIFFFFTTCQIETLPFTIYFHHPPPPPFFFSFFSPCTRIVTPPPSHSGTVHIRCTRNLPPSSRRELRTTATGNSSFRRLQPASLLSRRPTLHRFSLFFFASMPSEWVPFTATFICHHYENLRLVASLDLTHLTDSDVAAFYIPCFLPFFFLPFAKRTVLLLFSWLFFFAFGVL